MILDLQLTPSPTSFVGGTDVVAGAGMIRHLGFGGTWAVGDTVSIILTDTGTGTQTLVGAGDVTGITPTFGFTYDDKEYLLQGSTVNFSALGDAEIWNNPEGLGNGFVTLGNYQSTPEDLVSLAPYQGRLAFFARRTTQIWEINADPTLWQKLQVLENTGTMAKLSVRAIGELDVFFLSDSGVRSIRARDFTNNAVSFDIGSPIDSLIGADLLALTEAQKAAACAVVEPVSNRYWLYLNGKLYVYSRFDKIAAWSRYEPTYDEGEGFQVSMGTIEKLVTFQDRVFARAGTKLFRYGGSDNNTYDSAVATAELPWLDLKSPGTIKFGKGIDVAATGAWTISAGMDPTAVSPLQNVPWNEGSGSSFTKGIIPFKARGTHFKLKAVTTGNTAAKLSGLLFHYTEGQEK